MNNLTDKERKDLHSALYDSIDKGKLASVKYILFMDGGLNPLDLNKPLVDYFDPPLVKAANSGNLEVVKALVDKGVVLNQKNKSGRTPIWVAAEKGHLDVVRYLVDKGADPNEADNIGQTPIWVAAREGNLDVVRYLVEEAKVEDLNKENNYNVTPIRVAASGGHLDVVQYLVDKSDQE